MFGTIFRIPLRELSGFRVTLGLVVPELLSNPPSPTPNQFPLHTKTTGSLRHGGGGAWSIGHPTPLQCRSVPPTRLGCLPWHLPPLISPPVPAFPSGSGGAYISGAAVPDDSLWDGARDRYPLLIVSPALLSLLPGRAPPVAPYIRSLPP